MTKLLKTLFLFIFITSCGYQSVLVNKSSNITINKFQKYGEEKSSNKIIKYLDQFKKENGEFVVSVDSNFSKDISSKNKKGNPETFSMKLNVEIVLENADITINNSFIEIVSYNNKDSKFKLKEFERKLKNNLIEKISQDIVTYIQSL